MPARRLRRTPPWAGASAAKPGADDSVTDPRPTRSRQQPKPKPAPTFTAARPGERPPAPTFSAARPDQPGTAQRTPQAARGAAQPSVAQSGMPPYWPAPQSPASPGGQWSAAAPSEGGTPQYGPQLGCRGVGARRWQSVSGTVQAVRRPGCAVSAGAGRGHRAAPPGITVVDRRGDLRRAGRRRDRRGHCSGLASQQQRHAAPGRRRRSKAQSATAPGRLGAVAHWLSEFSKFDGERDQ